MNCDTMIYLFLPNRQMVSAVKILTSIEHRFGFEENLLLICFHHGLNNLSVKYKIVNGYWHTATANCLVKWG